MTTDNPTPNDLAELWREIDVKILMNDALVAANAPAPGLPLTPHSCDTLAAELLRQGVDGSLKAWALHWLAQRAHE